MIVAQYFAQLDDNNIVINVAVVTRLFLEENPERYPGTWVETFVDAPNKTYAGIGFTYDFIAPYVPPRPPLNETLNP
jgi:hypothetical protein